ncbi:DUF4149 domain-containing protein [Helicobacter salomonis]|uniref:DUF4149 domain-containing protein n=1 Tax=Helicobacter salomonis TaxID=56878 RepID=UPI000CF034AA|nr:DUF4149 domain-containing protein [Helicobacter salomonis]
MLGKLWGVVFLLVLGMGIGVVLFAGAGVAPVLFKAPTLAHVDLSILDAGALMGRIFVRANTLLNVLGVFLALDSAFLILAKRRRGALLVLLSIIGVGLITLFSFYYTPNILQAQAMGTTATPEFARMHMQSEMLFKVLPFVLCALFVGRAWRLCR